MSILQQWELENAAHGANDRSDRNEIEIEALKTRVERLEKRIEELERAVWALEDGEVVER